MQLALNYSPEAAELLQAGRITIDRFKCPDWPDLIATAAVLRPVYVHYPLRAGAGEQPDWDTIARLREQTKTPFVNVHLDPPAALHTDIPSDAGDPAHVAAIAERMAHDVAAACERFGAEHVVVENVPYYGAAGNFMRAVAEPAAIRYVVQQTGCRFLLDLSHARISAFALGRDARAYIEELPLARLAELHITGIGLRQGRIADHMRLSEGDWPEVAWAFERIRSGAWARPQIVALEYGGIGPLFEWRSEAATLAADVPRLQAVMIGRG
jgi:uncharacterized protein (UPF0276 family)